MRDVKQASRKPEGTEQAETAPDTKPAYEAPRILKKRSVARVTLFSGGGVASGGLTVTG